MEEVNPQMQLSTETTISMEESNNSEQILIKKYRKSAKSATSIQMFVESNTDECYDHFSKKHIIYSLLKETDLTEQQAEEISIKVERFLIKNGFKTVTSSFIRSIINYYLTEYGNDKYLKYSSVSMPIYDFVKLIEEKNKTNSNNCFSPAAIDMFIGDNLNQQYALREIFNKDIAEEHKSGSIHIHDLSKITRPYCSGNSVEYIKINGLKLPGIAHSEPASHANTLANHLQCFASFLRTMFSGAIGVDAINVFFAPLLVDESYESIKQTAQHLIFSFAQLASGSDVCFSDFNLYLDVPEHLKNSPAVGKGGKYTGKTYKDYEKESKMFLKAILEVALKGDANGASFAFPKLDVHINEESFEQKNEELMDLICELNSKRGSAYILYDRGKGVKISECCRLSLEIKGDELERMIKHPEEARFAAYQNITINLPRIAYKYHTVEEMHSEIDRLVNIVMSGHKDKFNYISKLMDIPNGPLSFLAKGMDGKPYLRREEAKFLVGMGGLNEMVKIFTGFEMHESEDALIFGLEIMAYLNLSIKRESSNHGITAILEQTPGESCLMRFATLDLKHYPKMAKEFVKGNISTGEVYYTNSVHLDYSSQVDVLTRISKQGKFAKLIEAGQITHCFHGSNEPDPKSLKQLYKIVLTKTNETQTTDSPDSTTCKDCKITFKGIHDKCVKCGGTNIYSMARVVGYFSNISGWSKGKIAELRDRTRVSLDMDKYNSIDSEEEKIIFFQKPNCEKCDVVKKQLEGKINNNVQILNTNDYKGLALACYYGVDELPSLMKVKGEKIISEIHGAGSYLKWLKENSK